MNIFQYSHCLIFDFLFALNEKSTFSFWAAGGDQGLLNSFFSDWATQDIRKRLPFVYNVVSQAFYSYQPAVKQFVHVPASSSIG